MQLDEILEEMAKPKKICDKCGHQMSGYHYWVQGKGWKCKSSSTVAKKEESTKKDSGGKEPKKEYKHVNKHWQKVFDKETVEKMEKAAKEKRMSKQTA